MSTFLSLLFIVYCAEAGVLLIFAPWSPVWDRTVIQLPVAALRNLMLLPAVRGAVTGFGVVHLIWAAHDLLALFARRRAGAEAEL